MNKLSLLLLGLCSASCMEVGEETEEDLATTEAALGTPCAAAKVAELLAPATAAAREVKVTCSVTLPAGSQITKRVIFEGATASNQTLDCAGGTIDGGAGTFNANQKMIEVRSRAYTGATGAPAWEPPANVTIRDCHVIGAIRVWGMGQNGEAAAVHDSSRLPGHTARVRANAPRATVLDTLTITGTGGTPLYLAPGVTGTQLRHSTIEGVTGGPGIYLDTESAGNTIRDNAIHPDTGSGGRELIAVDGSSNNTIVDNHFSSLANGGIFLYRNCGEGGTIRISTPSNNSIINNVFFYKNYTGSNPSVYLGSRGGNPFPFTRTYCGDDAGFPFGSSANDDDFARNNGVLQNQIYVRSVTDMLQNRNLDINTPNVVGGNSTVTAELVRPAGCYVPNGFGTKFLADGQSTDVLLGGDGLPRCDGQRYTCHDGALTASAVTNQQCAFKKVAFDCAISDRDAGCTKPVSCPAGTTIVGAYGACNLETTSLAAPAPSNTLTVSTVSNTTSDGHCVVDGHDLSHARTFLTGLAGKASVSVGCREYDLFDGGDCHITGAIYCR